MNPQEFVSTIPERDTKLTEKNDEIQLMDKRLDCPSKPKGPCLMDTALFDFLVRPLNTFYYKISVKSRSRGPDSNPAKQQLDFAALNGPTWSESCWLK